MVVGTLSRAVAHVNFGAIVRSMELRGWALKALDGTARGCVRRSRNIPLQQLVGLESRFRRNGVLSSVGTSHAIVQPLLRSITWRVGVPNSFIGSRLPLGPASHFT